MKPLTAPIHSSFQENPIQQKYMASEKRNKDLTRAFIFLGGITIFYIIKYQLQKEHMDSLNYNIRHQGNYLPSTQGQLRA